MDNFYIQPDSVAHGNQMQIAWSTVVGCVVDCPRINLLRLFISAAGQVWDPKPSPESHQMELFKITLITELNGRKSIENLSISICISLQNASDCGDDGGGLWAGSKNNKECEVHNCIVRGVVTLTATAATDE